MAVYHRNPFQKKYKSKLSLKISAARQRTVDKSVHVFQKTNIAL